MPLKPGLAAVRKALDAKDIRIPISGPDLTGGVPPLNLEQFNFLDLLGAYDFHSYNENFDWLSKGQMVGFDKNTAAWAAWAHQNHKPLFMSEFGTMANGWGTDQPGPGSYESTLKDAELVIRRINAGVDGFNRWSFLNRGDLDGQWQFIETWDRKEGKLLKQYTPHPNTYFMLGLLSRFTAKHSDVLGCRVDSLRSDPWRQVFAAALRSPKGSLTLAVVNDAKAERNLSLELRGLAEERTLYRYRMDETQRDRVDVRIDPQAQWRLSRSTPAFQDRLPPSSLTIYTTYKLNYTDDGVMAE
jgi:hypothetical protein